MEVKANLNNLRIAPRKTRLVANLLKGLSYNEAKNQLRFMVKGSAKPISKLLDSAAANAENNFSLVKDNLYVKNIAVDEGVKLQRYKPKGFGRVMPIQKKTSRVRLVLDELTPGLKAKAAEKQKKVREEAVAAEQEPKDEKDREKTLPPNMPEYKPERGQKIKEGLLGGIKKKFFRRKSI